MLVRNFIIVTMVLPLFLLFAIWACVQLYWSDLFEGELNFSTLQFQTYSADAALLSGSYNRLLTPASPQSPFLLMVADLHLDSNWNSTSFSSRSGHSIARSLALSGIESIRYDHRGTGKTKASSDSYHDFALQAEDLRSIYNYAKKKSTRPLILLAHGTACPLVLYALGKWHFEIKGLFLISCGGEGNLISVWVRKLFFNMRRRGVQQTVLDKAREEWVLWQNSAQVLPIKDASHSDLGAFRAAMEFFASGKMASFREHAKHLDLFSLIHKQLATQKIPILHLTAEHDEERPLADQKSTRLFARVTQKDPSYGQFYRFQEIKDCDFFLKPQKTKAQGLSLLLNRYHPFRSVKPKVIGTLRDAMLNWGRP